MNFSLTLVLFKFPDVQSHGRQTSLDLVFTQKKKLSLRLAQSLLAMLLSPNSCDSQEPVPEAEDLVVTLEK